jgi:hypothetical protein
VLQTNNNLTDVEECADAPPVRRLKDDNVFELVIVDTKDASEIPVGGMIEAIACE